MGALFGMGFYASVFESGPKADDIGAAAVAFATFFGIVLLGIEYGVRARRWADRRDRRLLDDLRTAILHASGAKERA
jgi:hypothetical protein